MKIIIFGANEVGAIIASQFYTDNDITVIDNEKNRIDALNKLIQEAINPRKDSSGVLERGNFLLMEGDKVIQLVNRPDKGVMNGDIGQIKTIERLDGETVIIVKFDNGEVSYVSDEFDDLRLAYAISIHKAQGSEFSCAIVPFSMEYRFMLRRKLIYTAVTRAKDYLIMLGSSEALSIGVQGIEDRRKTKLKEKIIDAINHKGLVFDHDALNGVSDLSPFDFME